MNDESNAATEPVFAATAAHAGPSSAATAVATTGGVGQKLQLVGIRVGKFVSTQVANTLVESSIMTAAAASEVAEAATMMTVAQANVALEAAALVKVPLTSEQRVQEFTQFVKAYASENPTVLGSIQKLSAGDAAAFAIKASAVSIAVAGAVQQCVTTGYYMAGKSTASEHRFYSHQNAVASAGSVSGAAAGAAIGAILLPGAGPIVGSLIGTFAGGYAAPVVLPSKPPLLTKSGVNGGTEDTLMELYEYCVPVMRDDGEYVIVSHREATMESEEDMVIVSSPSAANDATANTDATPAVDPEAIDTAATTACFLRARRGSTAAAAAGFDDADAPAEVTVDRFVRGTPEHPPHVDDRHIELVFKLVTTRDDAAQLTTPLV